MTAHEILVAAKQELLTRGWTQGAFENPETGEVCALGALNRAVGGQPLMMLLTVESERVHTRAWQLLEAATGCAEVHRWNDDPARTPEDVLQAFDRAIALAETRDAVTA